MTIQEGYRKGRKKASPPCAFLWDESLIWGLMARRALAETGLPFDIITAEEIRRGMLDRYRMIFVPGGWASNKLDALQKQGQENIRRFVEKGGSYFGICGGAGMALEEGLGLLPIVRKPTEERVPSFSGGVRLACKEHTIWNGIDKAEFHVWWPSQFQIAAEDIEILAVYESPMTDAFTADIPIEHGKAIGWSKLERRYGILLNPSRLQGEPAVAGGYYGHGKVILSLIHFDTPDDRNGAIVLGNIWNHMTSYVPLHNQNSNKLLKSAPIRKHSPEVAQLIEEIRGAIEEFVNVGVRNFLWYWRNPMLLQWRRGVRGMEYTTLIAMIREILAHITLSHPDGNRLSNRRREGQTTELQLERDLAYIKELLIPFIEEAKTLLIRERFYMQTSFLSPLNSEDEEINRLRRKLFASAMRHGGDFKCLIDAVDRLLLRLMKENDKIEFFPAI